MIDLRRYFTNELDAECNSIAVRPFYRCATCPLGFKMSYNRTFCEDINEVIIFFILNILFPSFNRETDSLRKICFLVKRKCEIHNPCDPIAKCINLAPGFRCEACPMGFDGIHVNGYYSQSITEEYTTQICNDIDECEVGLSNCGYNSICINTIGSFTCQCKNGFIYNITTGCDALPGTCADGTICDVNAVCKHAEGSQVMQRSNLKKSI